MSETKRFWRDIGRFLDDFIGFWGDFGEIWKRDPVSRSLSTGENYSVVCSSFSCAASLSLFRFSKYSSISSLSLHRL